MWMTRDRKWNGRGQEPTKVSSNNERTETWMWVDVKPNNRGKVYILSDDCVVAVLSAV